jgi:hypothetical protein
MRQRSADLAVSAVDVIAGIDRHIAASTPDEAYAWVQLRGEIVHQEDDRLDVAHLRTMEKWGMIAKVGLSACAIATGAGMAIMGIGLPAFLCLGAGLYGLAPSFVDQVARRLSS